MGEIFTPVCTPPSHLALKIFQSKIFLERRKKKNFQMAAISKLSAIHQCPFAISLRVRSFRPSQNFVDLAQKIKKSCLIAIYRRLLNRRYNKAKSSKIVKNKVQPMILNRPVISVHVPRVHSQ